MEKIVEYSKSHPIDESIKSLTKLYENPDTKQLIKDTKEPPNIDSVLDKTKLKEYIFSKIIDHFESITNLPGEKDYKVYNLLKGIPDVVQPSMDAGNNNKTKNNKKSNKNKTKKRKRKNSSNRKFKFAKVKKI